MTAGPQRARAAFLRACALDVLVRKPGNVSVHSPGHGMDAALFFASAKAAAGPLFEPGARVGARIEAAVRATWAVAGCNTNLGIVLLCAPVAVALEQHSEAADATALRAAIVEVLGALDQADAAAAYRAIAHANPGGLGHAAEEDVRAEPDVDLRTAMALAADRDSIAAQYRDGYALLFDNVLPAIGPSTGAAIVAVGSAPNLAPIGTAFDIASVSAPDRTIVTSVQRAFVAQLASVPDSHIVRKRGPAAAAAVMHQARAWHARAATGASLDADPAFQAWDAALKADGINPGTSADLLVAGLMLAQLCVSVPKRDAAWGD